MTFQIMYKGGYKLEKQPNIRIKGIDSGVTLPGFTS